MPQQVNLYLPILRKRKESFTAQTLAQALVVLLLGGGLLAGFWVWNLQRASASLQQTLKAQEKETANLRSALAATLANAGPVQETLTQELAQRRTELQQRQAVLDALDQGIVQSGQGHAARLRLVAQTIPAAAWVNAIRSDSGVFEVSGFTLAPEALNGWVGKLAVSPLLQGQSLNAVKVEEVAQGEVPATPARWSFNLLSRSAVATEAKP